MAFSRQNDAGSLARATQYSSQNLTISILFTNKVTTQVKKPQHITGLEVNFLVHLQSVARKLFFHQQTGETTSKFFPFVWETWMIPTRKRLLVDVFLTRRLSKSLAFCEFASVNFWPCITYNQIKSGHEWRGAHAVILFELLIMWRQKYVVESWSAMFS